MPFRFVVSRHDETPIGISPIGLVLHLTPVAQRRRRAADRIDTINAPGFGPPPRSDAA
jgi:hypothetical protein